MTATRAVLDAGDVERSMGVDPIDGLLAQLEATREAWATGAALYGPGGTFDNLRKVKLSIVECSIRDEKAEKGEKVTEASIEQQAHADLAYTAWLDNHTVARANWLRLDAEREDVRMRINRGQAVLRSAANFLG